MKLKRITALLLAVLLAVNASPLVYAADQIRLPEAAEPAVEPETVPEEQTEACSEPLPAAMPELPVEKLPDLGSEAAQPLSEEDVAAVRLNTYDQFLGYYYLTYSPLSFYLNTEQLPYQTYVSHIDPDFADMVYVWRVGTMGTGAVAEYTYKEVDFYILILYDVIYQKLHQDSAIKKVATGVDAMQASLLLDLAELAANDADTLAQQVLSGMPVTDENFLEVLGLFGKCDAVADSAKAVGVLTDAIEFSGTLDELCEKLYMIETFIDCSDEIEAILEEIQNATSDGNLKAACTELRLAATGLLTEAEMAALFSDDILLVEVTDFALGKLWDAMAASNVWLAVPALGAAVGKLASNALCGTDATVESWYSIRMIYILEEAMERVVRNAQTQFINSPTVANARKFNKAADMYLNTHSVGMEYAVKFVEAAHGGGLLGWVYKNFTHSDDYTAMVEELESIGDSINMSVSYMNNNSYNFYLDELDAYAGTDFTWEQTPCDTDLEEVETSLASLDEILFRLTDQRSSVDTSFHEDQKTYANYTHSGGILDLNGKTLTVYGDFCMTGGTVNVHGGTLDVRGDLYVQGGNLYVNAGTVGVGGDLIAAKRNADGTYADAASHTNITMDNDADRITVSGSLISSFPTNSNSGLNCAAGEMTIGGGWTNYNTYGNPSGTFKMTFAGSGDLLLNGIRELYSPVMVIENAASRTITMQGMVKAGTLYGGSMTIIAKNAPTLTFSTTTGALDVRGQATLSVYSAAGGDITFSEGAATRGMALRGHTMTVNGDLFVNGAVTLGDSATGGTGILNVAGDLQLYAYKFYLNGGIVTVGGDFILAGINADGTYGPAFYSSVVNNSEALLTMDRDTDLIEIGGNLVTCSANRGGMACSAGEIRLGGSWTNYYMYTSPSGSFTATLTGTEDSTLHGVGVPNLVIENASSRTITMQGTVTAGTLYGGDMTINASGEPVLNFGTTTGKLDIHGRATLGISSAAGGDITFSDSAALRGMALRGHSLRVNGDLYSSGGVTLGDSASGKVGTLHVAGNLQHYSYNFHLNGGEVTVGGDFILAGINADGTYGPTYYLDLTSPSSAHLTMDNDADLMEIGGNLITWSARRGGMACSTGEIRLEGNWTNYYLYTVPSGSFTTTLTGTADRTLDGVSVPNLAIENASGRTITMRNTVKALNLTGDEIRLAAYGNPTLSFNTVSGSMTIDGNVNLAVPTKASGNITVNGDLYSSGLVMGANTLTVNGSLYQTTYNTMIFGASGTLQVNGDVHMTTGTLSLGKAASISGSVCQTGGELKVNRSTVNIAKDYRIQGADESTGEIEWTDSSGSLYMDKAEARIIVGGDFHMQSTVSHSGKLTAGTLVVLGDFFQHAGNAANFAASGDHTVLLCGTEPQTVTFESAGSRFNILQLSGYAESYTFTPASCWNTLEEAVAVPDEYYGTVIAQGSCGTDVTYALTDSGVLIISGSGSMKNYTGKSAMPWYGQRDGIRTVVIRDGVTAIGDYAFYGMPALTAVIMGDSVTSIGAYAFKNCTALKGAALPSGLTRMGESAFYACSSLTAMEIPASLWTVQPYTFKNCTALAQVTFHEGNLQKIGDGAFYNTALTAVVLPDCLTILDVYAFKNCAKLASITLSSSLTQIREASLYGTAISEITIPEGVTSIKSYAFKNCANLRSVDLPSTLTVVDEASFYACTALRTVELPDAVTTIGNYAFRKCAAIEELTFGKELTSIGECAFYGCTGLTEIVIPDQVTTIKPYAFKTCTGLASITLGSKVSTIGEGAFNTCTGLKTIVFPASLTAIGDYCFSGSYGLWKMTFEGNAPSIGTGAFKGLTATACYPGDNATWTSDVMQNYGGKITWTAA